MVVKCREKSMQKKLFQVVCVVKVVGKRSREVTSLVLNCRLLFWIVVENKLLFWSDNLGQSATIKDNFRQESRCNYCIIYVKFQNLKVMKKVFVFAAVMLLLTACSTDNAPMEEENVSMSSKQLVTISVSPITQETMGAKSRVETRASVPISNVVTRLDLWVVEGDATKAATQTTAVGEKHQTTADADFGSFSLMLDKNKTYTLYAVGHKESGPASIASGVVSFPDAKKLNTLVYAQTFKPSETTTLSCVMQRAVGMFRVVMKDEIPSEVKKIEIVAGKTPTQWSFPLQKGVTPRTDDYNVAWTTWKSETDGTTSFSIYILGSDTEQKYSVTVTAYDADDNVLKTRTFADVPIRDNYRSIYTGRFFMDTPFSSSFTVNDEWNDYEGVTY